MELTPEDTVAVIHHRQKIKNAQAVMETHTAAVDEILSRTRPGPRPLARQIGTSVRVAVTLLARAKAHGQTEDPQPPAPTIDWQNPADGHGIPGTWASPPAPK
jgi:hypothetical protein